MKNYKEFLSNLKEDTSFRTHGPGGSFSTSSSSFSTGKNGKTKFVYTARSSDPNKFVQVPDDHQPGEEKSGGNTLQKYNVSITPRSTAEKPAKVGGQEKRDKVSQFGHIAHHEPGKNCPNCEKGLKDLQHGSEFHDVPADPNFKKNYNLPNRVSFNPTTNAFSKLKEPARQKPALSKGEAPFPKKDNFGKSMRLNDTHAPEGKHAPGSNIPGYEGATNFCTNCGYQWHKDEPHIGFKNKVGEDGKTTRVRHNIHTGTEFSGKPRTSAEAEPNYKNILNKPDPKPKEHTEVGWKSSGGSLIPHRPHEPKALPTAEPGHKTQTDLLKSINQNLKNDPKVQTMRSSILHKGGTPPSIEAPNTRKLGTERPTKAGFATTTEPVKPKEYKSKGPIHKTGNLSLFDRAKVALTAKKQDKSADAPKMNFPNMPIVKPKK